MKRFGIKKILLNTLHLLCIIIKPYSISLQFILELPVTHYVYLSVRIILNLQL